MIELKENLVFKEKEPTIILSKISKENVEDFYEKNERDLSNNKDESFLYYDNEKSYDF